MLYPDVTYEIVDGPIGNEVQPSYGGPNAGVIQDCGRYRVPDQDQHAAASPAMGTVWIAYDPDSAEEEIDMLHTHGQGEMYIIVAPYPDLRASIVMTARGAKLELDSSLDTRIQAFIRDFAESGDVPHPNRNCSGEVAVPSE